MPLRRAITGLSLTLLVGVLAHALDFGNSHEPGGSQAEPLLHALWGAVALSGAWTLLSGALRPRCRLEPPNGRTLWLVTVAALALGGLAVFCGMESLEGHIAKLDPFLGFSLALAALVVNVAFRLAGVALRRLGADLAALLPPVPSPRLDATLCLHFRPPLVAAPPQLDGARRGRAPPSTPG